MPSDTGFRPEFASPANLSRQRTFQIVFALLTVHFASLAITYLVNPWFAVRQFSQGNEMLGGVEFAPPEVTAWRYATVCGMATLALMTLLMFVDLARNYSMLVPAAFFKGLNAVLWFWYAATNRGLPVFVAAGVLDLLIVALMVWAARRAHTALPPLAAEEPAMTGWLRFENRWRDQLFAAAIPRVDGTGLPGLGEVDTAEFWRRFWAAAPTDVVRALRGAVWVLTFAPLLLVRRPSTFPHLSPEVKDRYLDTAIRHRFWAVRELAGLVRLVACLAYFSDPGVRARVSGSAP